MTGGRISIPPPAGGVRQLTDAENQKTSFRSNWISRLSAMVSRWCRTYPTDWDQTADCSVRSTQLTPVEGVEELGPEWQLHRFANREVLDRGELRNGLMVWDLNGISREPWQNRTQSYSDPRWDATLPARRSMLITHGLSAVREHQDVTENHRERSDMVDGSQLDCFLGLYGVNHS